MGERKFSPGGGGTATAPSVARRTNSGDVYETDRGALTISDPLGSGQFGQVFKGMLRTMPTDDLSDISYTVNSERLVHRNYHYQEVAVKMLLKSACHQSRREFEDEIDLMRILGRHECLVNMIGCVTKSSPLCLILEYCSNGDLLRYMRDRRAYMISLENLGLDLRNLSQIVDERLDMTRILSLKDLLTFAVQVASGMVYLSSRNFIHRDLSARNVMVDDTKKAKIGDFGLCRQANTSSNYKSTGKLLPYKWMALESIVYRHFTTRSDIWSFGVLLFEIITLGGVPYASVANCDLRSHLEAGERMDQPDNCSDQLYKLMQDTWQADPSERPNFMTLTEKLSRMLNELAQEDYLMILNNAKDYYNVPEETCA